MRRPSLGYNKYNLLKKFQMVDSKYDEPKYDGAKQKAKHDRFVTMRENKTM